MAVETSYLHLAGTLIFSKFVTQLTRPIACLMIERIGLIDSNVKGELDGNNGNAIQSPCFGTSPWASSFLRSLHPSAVPICEFPLGRFACVLFWLGLPSCILFSNSFLI